MGTATTQSNTQTHPTKLKRRKCKETTISSSASASGGIVSTSRGKLDPSTVVSPDKNSWCCPAATNAVDGAPPPLGRPVERCRADPDSFSSSGSSPSSSFRIRLSLGNLSTVMDFTVGSPNGNTSSFNKFNSVLTAGLLNPMSPPPAPSPILHDKTRSSPSLFEMMASEPDLLRNRAPTQIPQSNGGGSAVQKTAANLVVSVQDKQTLTMKRISDLLASGSPGNQFNDPDSSDIKLTLSSKDGISVSMNVHRQILVAHSRFFAVKLSDGWVKQQMPPSLPYIVEIADCDDVEVYIETLRLMYCKDLRKKLMREDVPRVLGILKVSAAIGFDAGVLSCLDFLEAAPWAEDEEEKVASLLSELQLENVGASEVLKRVSLEFPNTTKENGKNSSDNEQVLLKLIHVVLEGKDEKARHNMKTLVSKMLRENLSRDGLRKESLYSACDECLKCLKENFLRASNHDIELKGHQIARQADNLLWISEILIDRQIAEDFLETWASQTEMAEAHPRIPAVHRHEVSQITAVLFVAIGKGQLLAPKETRCLLLKTWLVPFYDDFGWMRRASRGLDRCLMEEGLSNTVLTLPLNWQQEIFMGWFDRFLNCGVDCPNIQRGFEVWWRRAFQRKNGEDSLGS